MEPVCVEQSLGYYEQTVIGCNKKNLSLSRYVNFALWRKAVKYCLQFQIFQRSRQAGGHIVASNKRPTRRCAFTGHRCQRCIEA